MRPTAHRGTVLVLGERKTTLGIPPYSNKASNILSNPLHLHIYLHAAVCSFFVPPQSPVCLLLLPLVSLHRTFPTRAPPCEVFAASPRENQTRRTAITYWPAMRRRYLCALLCIDGHAQLAAKGHPLTGWNLDFAISCPPAHSRPSIVPPIDGRTHQNGLDHGG